ncbi:EthD domain-containing protein [Bradyrhizobium prioriisuperbiae]|uniref:EthD domain-containing protein n=1 Tax=Bradyrhizobium prioriisuperbiae TaxID=2854389 RepID=UPI0028F10E88|nr:EthD domain-containing protein [Bradyrhizobium prioritasuperba]
MLKLTILVKRRADLTQAQFDAHWRDRHGPLVRSHQDSLRIRRYVQTVPLDNPAAQAAIQASRGSMAADFDGCAELWWDSLEEAAAARATPEGVRALQALIEDERRFVDLSQSVLWYGTERQVIPDSA